MAVCIVIAAEVLSQKVRFYTSAPRLLVASYNLPNPKHLPRTKQTNGL
jgi:hypothetical protein